jgi:hypothetical protein
VIEQNAIDPWSVPSLYPSSRVSTFGLASFTALLWAAPHIDTDDQMILPANGVRW